jgi:hypothetical protein
MHIAHGGRDVRVPEQRLDVAERECAHGDGAEAVAQVVEPDAGETRGRDRRVVAPAERPAVDVLADHVAEDKVVVAREVLAPAEPVERPDQLGDERNAADLARLGGFLLASGLRPGAADVDALAGEVDVSPTEGEQLPLAESGVGRGQVEGGVQVVVSVRARAAISSASNVTNSPE